MPEAFNSYPYMDAKAAPLVKQCNTRPSFQKPQNAFLETDDLYSLPPAMTSPARPRSLLHRVWDGSIPLEIRLASTECRTFDQIVPYHIQCPRLSYWPFLLPRLHSFFASSLINPDVSFSDGWLSFEDVPLKWQYPVGLLYDLYAGNEPFRPGGESPTAIKKREEQEDGGTQGIGNGLPWRLVLHFTEWPQEHLVQLDDEGKNLHDAYINAVKEADFLRNGSAKVVMFLSKDDSTTLWSSVQDHSLQQYTPIYQKFLKPPGSSLRHIPLKFYLPTTTTPGAESTADAPPQSPGSVRIVQTLLTATLPGSTRQPMNLGAALHVVLPTLFPSRRRSLLAEPVLHGAVVPLAAPLEELLREAAYADGWLHVVIVMMS